MSYDITKKRAAITGDIELKNGDGSPMTDDKGNVLSVTVYSPASKQWEQAHAEMQRKRAEKVRKSGGRVEGALDNVKEGQIDFLCRVTVSLNGFEYKGEDPIRALYEDDQLGFVRDHVYGEVNDWSAFTKVSAKS